MDCAIASIPGHISRVAVEGVVRHRFVARGAPVVGERLAPEKAPDVKHMFDSHGMPSPQVGSDFTREAPRSSSYGVLNTRSKSAFSPQMTGLNLLRSRESFVVRSSASTLVPNSRKNWYVQ